MMLHLQHIAELCKEHAVSTLLCLYCSFGRRGRRLTDVAVAAKDGNQQMKHDDVPDGKGRSCRPLIKAGLMCQVTSLPQSRADMFLERFLRDSGAIQGYGTWFWILGGKLIEKLNF